MPVRPSRRSVRAKYQKGCSGRKADCDVAEEDERGGSAWGCGRADGKVGGGEVCV